MTDPKANSIKSSDYQARLMRRLTMCANNSSWELVMIPVPDPVMVPVRDPVMVPVLEPVIVPVREPVMVPTRAAEVPDLDPVMVPA